MAPWAPGDPWPSPTRGGALSPHWGGYTKLWVRAAIGAGTPFHMGPTGTPPPPTADLLEPFNDFATNGWSLGATTPTIAAGRTGTAASTNGTSGYATWTIPAAKVSDTVTAGCAFRYTGAINGGAILQFRGDAAATNHTNVALQPNGQLTVRRNNSILATSVASFAADTWHYIEVRFVLHDTAGSGVVRVNGVEVINVTGVDTRNAGTAAVYDALRIGAQVASNPFLYDDLYVTAGPGGVFLGDITIPPTVGRVADPPDGSDRLDAGNVMSNAAIVARSGEPIDRLWVDMSCDAIDVAISGGAASSEGIFSKADAATVTVTIMDPHGIYDPLNPTGPYSFGGRSRLQPGTPVEVFCEVVDGDTGTWSTHILFTGTADSWQEDWTPHPWDRQAILIATDPTKVWARYNRPEASPVGAGDSTGQRINRLVAYFGWPGGVAHPPGGSAVTLQATTLAQPGWELLNRTTDDELGFVHFTPEGQLRWVNRLTWRTRPAPSVTLGCDVGHDVLLDATPSALDTQMRNAVYAARAGGTTRTAKSQASIDRYGQYDYTRTDLGVQTDDQAGEWATSVVEFYAYPQVTLDDVTFRPAIAAEPWTVYQETLPVRLVSDIVRIVWTPPDLPTYVIDNQSRVVGYSHTINRQAWETRWQLVATRSMQYAGVIFTMGPHTRDRLNAGFVVA